MKTDFPTCTHRPVTVDRFEVMACGTCGLVEWFESGRPCDPAVGMAGLFGDYDLVGRLPAVNAPGDEVLLYRPSRVRDRRGLTVFDPHIWYRAADDLWLCHDGHLLMLAPQNPLVIRNLNRGA